MSKSEKVFTTNGSIIGKVKICYSIFLFILVSVGLNGKLASATPQIDKFLTDEISKLLDKGLFGVVSDCAPLKKNADSPDQAASKYFPFKILTPKVDQSSIEHISSFKCQVDLVIDKKVSGDMQTLIERKVRVIMNIDDKDRVLTAKTGDLMIKASDALNADSDDKKSKMELEAMKIENERAKLKNQELGIAMEREKLDASLAKQKLEEQLKQALEKASASNAEETAEASKPIEDKSIIETMGLPLSIALIAAAFVVLSFFFKSAFNNVGSKLAGSIAGIGDSIVQASQGLSQESSGSGSADSVSNQLQSEGQVQTEISDHNMEMSPYEQEQNDRYLKLVEEKLTVLASEKNFNFLRHFSELILHHPAEATAIVMSLSPEVSKSVISLLNSQLIERLAGFMSDPHAVNKVQKIKKTAIQSFYSVIVLDEFVNSPLSRVKEADWLFKLKSDELAAIALKLTGEEQAAFLSIFTSSRLKDIFESMSSPQDRKTLFSALPAIKKGSKAGIDEILKSARASYESLPGAEEGEIKIISNLSEHLGNLINLLQDEQREELVAALSADKDLFESLKDYYIPFSELELLSQDNLYDIFGKRPAAQTAATIFAESELLIERIVGCLPEAFQSIVKDEIKTLNDDAKSRAKNLKRASDLKNEITKTLIRFKKEGLLIYAQSENKEQAPQAA